MYLYDVGLARVVTACSVRGALVLLDSTYIHAAGVGVLTERRLWDAGARTWEDYLAAPAGHWPLTSAQRAALTPIVEESRDRLEVEDAAWFSARIPGAEHWRAVPNFGHRIAFLDIETTGGMEADDLTIVGLFDGFTFRQFVKGVNLEEFPEAIADTALLVTFFGTGFDLPFLRRAYPGLPLRQLHVDLCYALKRLGYRGGLKSIESQLGVRRSDATRGLSGWDAVRLWQEYLRGRTRSLDTLLAYNEEDVRNMADLLRFAYPRLANRASEGELGAIPPRRSASPGSARLRS